MISEFVPGDILVEIRYNTKYVVRQVFWNQYELGFADSSEGKPFSAPIEYVDKNFVKVGSGWIDV